MLSAVYFTYASQINNVMSYDAVAFLNSSFAVLVGIGVGAVLFATFFPETPAREPALSPADSGPSEPPRQCSAGPTFDLMSAPCANSSGQCLPVSKTSLLPRTPAWRVQLPVSPLDKRSAD